LRSHHEFDISDGSAEADDELWTGRSLQGSERKVKFDLQDDKSRATTNDVK